MHDQYFITVWEYSFNNDSYCSELLNIYSKLQKHEKILEFRIYKVLQFFDYF